jgi:HNH endonuclease
MESVKEEMLEAVDLLLKHRNKEIPDEVYDEALVTIRRLIQYHGPKFGVIDHMAQLYESGTPVAEIEKATGRDRTWIYECLKRLEVKIRPHGRRGGETHPCWKGGRYADRTGYVRLRKRGDIMANKDGIVPEHRFIMATHLGRSLLPTEVVHHIDGNPNNNAIENLCLFPSQSAHMAFHKASRGKGSNGA